MVLSKTYTRLALTYVKLSHIYTDFFSDLRNLEQVPKKMA